MKTYLIFLMFGLAVLFEACSPQKPYRSAARKKQNRSVSSFKGNVKKKKTWSDYDVFASRGKKSTTLQTSSTIPCPEFKTNKKEPVNPEAPKSDKETVFIVPKDKPNNNIPENSGSTDLTTTVANVPDKDFADIDQIIKINNGYMRPLLFVFDKDELSEEDMNTLRTAARYAQKGYHLVLEGHTDNLGADKYNENLSVKRAERIKKMMIETMNVSASSIAVEGKGESKPVLPNTTTESRQANRRVEIKLGKK